MRHRAIRRRRQARAAAKPSSVTSGTTTTPSRATREMQKLVPSRVESGKHKGTRGAANENAINDSRTGTSR